MKNRESAMQSRERKKMYVKDLEMKSKYLESECRRLDYALRCCMAENAALHQHLQKVGAPAARQESAVLVMGKTIADPDFCCIFILLFYNSSEEHRKINIVCPLILSCYLIISCLPSNRTSASKKI